MTAKELNVCFIDTGASIDLIRTLIGKFKSIYYYTVWYQGGFPSISPYYIGRGIEGVTKVNDFWKLVDSKDPYIDLFVFTDCYGNDEAEHLRSLGRKCYSAGYGEKFELDRIGLKEVLKAKGLPVTDYFVSEGIKKLKIDLKDITDRYVKLAQPLRGVTETFHFVNMKLSESEIDDIANRLGCVKELVRFIVEKPIGTPETHSEIGYDGNTASGKFPIYGMCGAEIKDVLYAGRVMQVVDMPKPITDINNAFVEDFKFIGYKGQFHTEIKYGADKQPFLIDFTARNGFPPSELMYTMYSNMADVLNGIANDEPIDPIFNEEEPFGVQVIIHSEWAEKNPQAVYIPEVIRGNVFLKNYILIDGVIHVIPQDYGLQEIGAVTATGKTLEQAKERAQKICEQIEGIHLEFPIDKFDKIDEEIELMEKLGVNFFKDEKPKEPEKAEPPKPEPPKVEPTKPVNPKVKKFLEKIQI